jgi:hypothetical protein
LETNETQHLKLFYFVGGDVVVRDLEGRNANKNADGVIESIFPIRLSTKHVIRFLFHHYCLRAEVDDNSVARPEFTAWQCICHDDHDCAPSCNLKSRDVSIFASSFNDNMSLLITIFLLVFIAQLVTWVGKTVLLDIVGATLSSPPLRHKRLAQPVGLYDPLSFRPIIFG